MTAFLVSPGTSAASSVSEFDDGELEKEDEMEAYDDVMRISVSSLCPFVRVRCGMCCGLIMKLLLHNYLGGK